MKTLVNTLLILAITVGSVAFTSSTKKNINVDESSIQWKGKKVLGSHTGTIKLKEGFLEMDGDQLTGGMFVVDMTTISAIDMEEEMKTKLEGHLKSTDFFGVENHPTSTLIFANVIQNSDNDGYTVTGDITIKDITESITFNLTMANGTANADISIDRTKFGVRYGSGSFFDNLGDNTISDNFELSISLVF